MGSYVQYASADDYQAAKIVSESLGWPMLKTSRFTPQEKEMTLVIVGGGEANPVYNDFIWNWKYIRTSGKYIYALTNQNGKSKVWDFNGASQNYHAWCLDRLPTVPGISRGPVPYDWGARPVTPDDKDHILVGKWSNMSYLGHPVGPVVFVAGYTKEDTLASARWVAAQGLEAAYIPKADALELYGKEANPDEGEGNPVDPPLIRKGKIFEFYFKDMSGFLDKFPPITQKYVGGGLSKLVANKQKLIDGVNTVMPEGWQLNQVTIANNKLAFEFEDKHSPLLVIGIVLAAIASISVVWGIIITWWKAFDWKKEEQQTAQKDLMNENARDDAELIQEMVDKGIIQSPEDAVTIIEALKEIPEPEAGSGFNMDSLKELLVLGLGGAIIIVLLQQTKR